MVGPRAFQAARGKSAVGAGRPGLAGGMTTPEPAAAEEGTVNVAALIIWVSAAAGGLPLRPAGLTGYASGCQGAAATCLPVAVISARARTTTGGSGSSVWRQGAIR
jgi:hypothetical protein